MSISKDDLHKMIDSMNDQQTATVYDFARYIIDRQVEDFWKHIDSLPPDEHPLSDEEKEQIDGGDEFISLGDAKRELGL